MEKIPSLNFL